MPIFANHAHVSPESLNPKGTIDRLLRLLDACGIDNCVCFAPFPHACDASFDPNKWLADSLRGQDRLIGFGTIDFCKPDIADQVDRAVQLGFRGLKLHPNAQEFAITEDRALKAYAAAEARNVFITFHSGVHQSRLRDTHPLLFDEVAWQFPKLRFSLEHVGGYHFFKDTLAVLFNHVPPPWDPGVCNLYAGLASIFSPTNNRFWYLRPDQIRECIAQIGVSQQIFGLDFPYNKETETRLAIETIRDLKLSPADTDAILGGNLRRVLGLR